MKRLVLLLAFVIISANGFCQSLGLDDLVRIMKMNPSETNEFLSAKGWELKGSENTESIINTEITWAFDLQKDVAKKWLLFTYDSKEKTEHEDFVSYSGSGVFNTRLRYITTSDADLKAVKDKIRQYKMQQIESQVLESGFLDIYKGRNYIVEVLTEKENSTTRHMISVVTHKHYNDLGKDDRYTITPLNKE